MEREQQYVIETFSNSFSKFKSKRILLYGVGKNTKAILENDKDFNFLGLMDQNTVGEVIYGLPVLSIDDVIKNHSDDMIIVIIARESVISIIYKRIEILSVEYGIPIYDIQGKNISKESQSFIPVDTPYWMQSYEKLCAEIDNHKVISFDIFDTLLMRRILLPEDVFEVVELKLENRGIKIPFKNLRLQAERELCGIEPNIDEIYYRFEYLLKDNGLDCICDKLDYIKRVEINTDRLLLTTRKVVVDAFRYAVKSGKDVYLLTDMYYSSDLLSEILSSKGIVGYKKVFVSNEINCTKESGEAYSVLFNKINNDFNKNDILHIGDNRRADVDMAQKNGFDVFHVYSGYELLMASSMKDLLVDTLKLSKRISIGIIGATLFNDPFCLGKSKGYVCVDDLSILGYVFVAPIIEEFVRWMDRIIKEKEIDRILFASRDGFLIQKIYKILTQNEIPNFYFRTSRRAVTVPAIFGKDDIYSLAKRKYNGNFGSFLRDRYGISMMDENSEILTESIDHERLISIIDHYVDVILRNASKERMNYCKYLNCNGIFTEDKNERVAIFDFVTSGTIQYSISKILERDIIGICFATMNLPNNMYEEKTDKIFSMYENFTSYGCKYALGRNYLILESVLTDDRNTFLYVDDYGNEKFEGEGTNPEYKNIKKSYNGIIE